MIKGTICSLKLLEAKDLNCLFDIYQNSSGTEFVEVLSQEVTKANFTRVLFGNQEPEIDVKVFCILYEEDIVGFINLTNISLINRSGFVGSLIVKDECRCKGIGEDAISTLIEYAFNNLNLNRVHTAINDAGNLDSILKSHPYIKYEGTSRESHFEDGKWIDVKRYAVIRKDFNKYMERIGGK